MGGRATTRRRSNAPRRPSASTRPPGTATGRPRYSTIGWYRAQLGEPAQALVDCRRSLALLQTLGDRQGEADAWDSIGFAHHRMGQYDRAIACYERAAELHAELGGRRFEAENLVHLGDTHHATGNHDAAHAAWRRALPILEDLDHPDAALVRTNLQLRGTGADGFRTNTTHRPLGPFSSTAAIRASST